MGIDVAGKGLALINILTVHAIAFIAITTRARKASDGLVKAVSVAVAVVELERTFVYVGALLFAAPRKTGLAGAIVAALRIVTNSVADTLMNCQAFVHVFPTTRALVSLGARAAKAVDEVVA